MQAATDQGESAALTYFAFDLLFLDGEDLRQLPLKERKRRLYDVLQSAPAQIRYTEHIVGEGGRVYSADCSYMVLQTADGSPRAITKIERRKEERHVFTLTTDHSTHNFIASNLIHKNKRT